MMKNCIKLGKALKFVLLLERLGKNRKKLENGFCLLYYII